MDSRLLASKSFAAVGSDFGLQSIARGPFRWKWKVRLLSNSSGLEAAHVNSSIATNLNLSKTKFKFQFELSLAKLSPSLSTLLTYHYCA